MFSLSVNKRPEQFGVPSQVCLCLLYILIVPMSIVIPVLGTDGIEKKLIVR